MISGRIKVNSFAYIRLILEAKSDDDPLACIATGRCWPTYPTWKISSKFAFAYTSIDTSFVN